MFKGLSNLASMLSQASTMRGRMEEIQENLRKVRVKGEAGAGMVVVEMNGQQQAISCQIDPSLLEGNDREMLEDLVVVAVNHALNQSKEAAAAEMSKLMQGMDMGGMGEMLSKLGG